MSYELEKISEEIKRLYKKIDTCEESIKEISDSEIQLSRLFQHIQVSSKNLEKDTLLEELDDKQRDSLLVTFVNNTIASVADALNGVRYNKKYYLGVIDATNDSIASLQEVSVEIHSKKIR